MTRQRLRALLPVALLAVAGAGCAAIPIDPEPAPGCQDAAAPGERIPRPEYCARRYLVVGLFPTIGEHHLNDLSTKSMPLTPLRRTAELTLLPIALSIINFTGFGLPSLYGLMYEPGQEWDQSQGACSMAALGFCKAARSVPRPGGVPEDLPAAAPEAEDAE